MINIIAPINQLGYGIASLNIVKHLNNITNIALWPIGQPQVSNKEDFDVVQYCINNSKMPNFESPCVRIWHQNDMSQFVGKGLRIGFPIFELDKFNKIEKHHLSNLDKIFVCSSWAKEIVLSQVKIEERNVSIVPLGVDFNIFKLTQLPDNSKTIFFNCGKWEIRKGHDIIPEIFNSAFEESDNVELWMMCENPFCSNEENLSWKNLYLNSKLANKIKILPRVQTQQEVYNIMKNTHCGIFPSRAEGWNLELLEMMSCGRHVITTNYSAHTEFCNENNSFLIDITSTTPAYDGKWFHGDGNWASISKKEIEQSIEYMRHVHKKNQDNSLRENAEGAKTGKLNFTWENSARRIKNNVL